MEKIVIFENLIKHDESHIIEYLEKKNKIDDNLNQRLLLDSAENKKIKLFSFLLAKDTNVNIKNQKGGTPLQLILTQHNSENSSNSNLDIFKLVKALLDKKADPNIVSPYYETPLILAISNNYHENYHEAVKLLLQNGANPSLRQKLDNFAYPDSIYKKEGRTPLYHAIFKPASPIKIAGYYAFRNYDNSKIVKLLCNAGASFWPVIKKKGIYKELKNENILEELCKDFFIAGRPDLVQKYIETIITHTRFDIKELNDDKKAAIWTTLLILNRLYVCNDLKWKILEKLPLGYQAEIIKRIKTSQPFKDKYIKSLTDKRVHKIKKVLEMGPYKGNEDGCKYLPSLAEIKHYNVNKDASIFKDLIPLLDGSKLKKDYSEFTNKFSNNINSLPEDNLVKELHQNCSALLEKKPSNNNA